MEEEDSSISVVLSWVVADALIEPIRCRALKGPDAISPRCSSSVAVRDLVRWLLPSTDGSSSLRSTGRDRVVARGDGALLPTDGSGSDIEE